jgi:Ca2+-binding RTX toxin-like protein
MVGDVRLGFGDDLFDNILGQVEGGSIQGSAGDDTFRPGTSAEAIDGGADQGGLDIDTLDFRSSAAGLRVALLDADGSGNTGRAKGDTYLEIERVLGSRTGADVLSGDGQGNTLQGLGGRDVLSGGDGHDRLLGGAGKDRLTGDLGNDAFEFRKLKEGGDAIRDFGNVGGDADHILIQASGFAGLEASGLFLTEDQFAQQLNNKAGTEDVRFIWEMDATRLWYDRDGKDGAEAVLLADLQDGATLERVDLFLV